VRDSFTKYLLHAYSDYPLEKMFELSRNMHRQINAGDSAGFNTSLRLLIANIPNILHKDNEGYYHSLFMLAMKMLGFEIQGEVMTNIGRIDAVLQQPKLTVIVEIRYDADKTLDKLLDEAMTQIYDRKYYEAYADRKVMLMAIAFTNKEVKCQMKEL
jgi:Holliday junction resolvase-like predicted endonuclease